MRQSLRAGQLRRFAPNKTNYERPMIAVKAGQPRSYHKDHVEREVRGEGEWSDPDRTTRRA
jgi:hypothetical protein